MKVDKKFIFDIYKKSPEHFYVKEEEEEELEEEEYCKCNYPMEIDESMECEWCGLKIKSDF